MFLLKNGGGGGNGTWMSRWKLGSVGYNPNIYCLFFKWVKEPIDPKNSS